MPRALLATALAVFVLAIASAPHAHAGLQDRHECLACVTSSAEAATTGSPEVAPPTAPAALTVVAPGLPPVTGAPLGAIPGQSPPLA